MIQCTSAEAAKLLRGLNEKLSLLLSKENQSKEFVAAINEDIESVRPQYHYANVQQEIDQLEQQIRKLKHAINVFNTTHKVPNFDMTIDEMLVYIPQLSARKMKLQRMANRLPKERKVTMSGSNIIDYVYANYDVEKVEQDMRDTSDLLAQAQTALDLVNNSETIEIEL